MKIIDRFIGRKLEDMKEQAVETIDDLDKNHPAILYGGGALIIGMGITILFQKSKIDCYKIVSQAQHASSYLIMR